MICSESEKTNRLLSSIAYYLWMFQYANHLEYINLNKKEDGKKKFGLTNDDATTESENSKTNRTLKMANKQTFFNCYMNLNAKMQQV